MLYYIIDVVFCKITENEVLIMDEYIVVKALENGVNIIGLTSGKDTKFHHTEKLDKGRGISCSIHRCYNSNKD